MLISLIGSAVVGRAATASYQALAWYWKWRADPLIATLGTPAAAWYTEFHSLSRCSLPHDGVIAHGNPPIHATGSVLVQWQRQWQWTRECRHDPREHLNYYSQHDNDRETTRYLSAATQINPDYARAVVARVVHEPYRALAPAHGADVTVVARWALDSIRRIARRDAY